MAVIYPEGLFNGDRFSLVSDSARFAWPYFWCASNSLGRIELNYRKVIARAFGQFRRPPSEEQFWAWVKEFCDAFLLFPYQHNGQTWGQWDTSEKFLPKHKLAADRESPAPDHGEFVAWKERYIAIRQQRTVSKAIDINNFRNPSETFCTTQHGIGIGSGKNIWPSGDGHTPEPTPPSSGKTQPRRDEVLEWFNAEFWPIYPRKVKKPAALKAARKHGRTAEARAAIVAGLRQRLPWFAAQVTSKGDFRPHPASWLNEERWAEAPETGAGAASRSREYFPPESIQ